MKFVKKLNRSKDLTRSRDPVKEKSLNALSAVLQQVGIEVRREKLKQGHGWKVLSGACKFHNKNVLFVDRRMPVDDQLAFLTSKVISLNISLPEGILSQSSLAK